ncbi:MAG: Zn-dependent hydrolase [Candidatus Saccharibacteria bacterium]|nr:Zn-dependent hydrolase [Candidatus Saccharibacteria bacterium]
MDLQFYGANTIVLTVKGNRVVFDDNLADLGGKSVAKAGDIQLFTGPHAPARADAKISFDSPGEYEVADVSITGIPARAHIDEAGQHNATIFRLQVADTSVAVVGHVYPELSDAQLELLNIIDVLFIPVGGNGYTLDPVGALKLIKKIEPKLVIPTHYDDGLNYPVPQQPLEEALKVLAMEPKETTSKLRVKPADLTDTTQLVVLQRP